MIQGTKVVIEGWADLEMRTVLLKANMTINGKHQTATQVVYTRNLKYTINYLLTQARQVVGSSSGSNDEAGSSASVEHDKDLSLLATLIVRMRRSRTSVSPCWLMETS